MKSPIIRLNALLIAVLVAAAAFAFPETLSAFSTAPQPPAP